MPWSRNVGYATVILKREARRAPGGPVIGRHATQDRWLRTLTACLRVQTGGDHVDVRGARVDRHVWFPIVPGGKEPFRVEPARWRRRGREGGNANCEEHDGPDD